MGKSIYGEGVIELRKHIFDEIPIIDPGKINESYKRDIEKIFLKLCDAKRRNDSKMESIIQEELNDKIFEILGIKGAKEEVYRELKLMRETRKLKKKAEVMIKND